MRRDPDPDLRYDPRENIETALFAMGEMGLYRWWSTYPIAKANLGQTLFIPLVMVDYDESPPLPLPTPTPIPPPYPEPEYTVLPPVCPVGTPAPPQTFTDIGTTATLAGSHGISCRVCVAGLQTLIIWGFTYDGTGAGTVDIRLLKGNVTVAKLKVLDNRAYDGSEPLYLCIPYELRDGDADRIAVYSTEEGLYAVGIFGSPPQRPRPTRRPTTNPKATPSATPKALVGS